MSFLIERGDITKIKCDAIVNAANSSLLGGGGVDGAIHAAAGRELQNECKTLGGCETGRAKITKGYRLPCRYVIHTVGPIWRGGEKGEAELLASCYRESLRLAQESGCETVAFPLISAGAYGYPIREAIKIAQREITAFLQENDMNVTLVLYGGAKFPLSQEEETRVQEYLLANFRQPTASYSLLCREEERAEILRCRTPKEAFELEEDSLFIDELDEFDCESASACRYDVPACEAERLDEIDERINRLREGFSSRLMQLIDERGWTDAQCYRRANVDRRLFSKIRSNPNYHPKKETALAFALALGLNRAQTDELLACAGYALSDSVKADVIVSYYIERGISDVFLVNEMLFAYGQPLLGECRG